MSKPVLAYLGLGLMGDPMTKRLLAAGYQVHVWNRSKAKLAPALALGAIAAAPQAWLAGKASAWISASSAAASGPTASICAAMGSILAVWWPAVRHKAAQRCAAAGCR